eukprot:scaffold186267_cov31-Tisochrysis_lutea.AAC.1
MVSAKSYPRSYVLLRENAMIPLTTEPCDSSRGRRKYNTVCFQCVGVSSGAVRKSVDLPPREVKSKCVSK